MCRGFPFNTPVLVRATHSWLQALHDTAVDTLATAEAWSGRRLHYATRSSMKQYGVLLAWVVACGLRFQQDSRVTTQPHEKAKNHPWPGNCGCSRCKPELFAACFANRNSGSGTSVHATAPTHASQLPKFTLPLESPRTGDHPICLRAAVKVSG